MHAHINAKEAETAPVTVTATTNNSYTNQYNIAARCERRLGGLEGQQQKSLATLQELREAAPGLLKVHHSVVEMQKRAQVAANKIEEVKVALEGAKASLRSLQQETQKVLSSELSARNAGQQEVAEAVALLQLHIARLEKKIALDVQETETRLLEDVTRLCVDCVNQAEGYKVYVTNCIGEKEKDLLDILESCKKGLLSVKTRGRPENKLNEISTYVQEEVARMLKTVLAEGLELIQKREAMIHDLEVALQTARGTDLNVEQKDKLIHKSMLDGLKSQMAKIEADGYNVDEELEAELNNTQKAVTEHVNSYLTSVANVINATSTEERTQALEPIYEEGQANSKKLQESCANTRKKHAEEITKRLAALDLLAQQIQEAKVARNAGSYVRATILKLLQTLENYRKGCQEARESFVHKLQQAESQLDLATQLVLQ